MPISIELLYKLVDAIENTISSQYQRFLFKAMFLTAFHGFLRVGEITSSSNCISVSNTNFDKNSVSITLPSYKHSHGHAAVIHIHRSSDRPAYCPVSAGRRYFTPLQVLRNALSFLGVASGQYNTASESELRHTGHQKGRPMPRSDCGVAGSLMLLNHTYAFSIVTNHNNSLCGRRTALPPGGGPREGAFFSPLLLLTLGTALQQAGIDILQITGPIYFSIAV